MAALTINTTRPSIRSAEHIRVRAKNAITTTSSPTTGGTDEGFSIPAQREAVRRKTEQLKATIIEEFVDAGAVPLSVLE